METFVWKDNFHILRSTFFLKSYRVLDKPLNKEQHKNPFADIAYCICYATFATTGITPKNDKQAYMQCTNACVTAMGSYAKSALWPFGNRAFCHFLG